MPCVLLPCICSIYTSIYIVSAAAANSFNEFGGVFAFANTFSVVLGGRCGKVVTNDDYGKINENPLNQFCVSACVCVCVCDAAKKSTVKWDGFLAGIPLVVSYRYERAEAGSYAVDRFYSCKHAKHEMAPNSIR